ncbi:hypothetical protein A1O3_09085 [Capronia epimyces CBS 606.96]|uniref:Methyltransferase n=1 Tax=Capronia epimyces CBS 606.96 TaxID=1182542 RepID=W9XLU0_9EURO|nr:uncharacterized protein A1O3_09085 [Capronia epimyces CBS 606.96]EXJ77926.1 hypothetical protein A1O3_09085 [Capronia epimyces CBS 606.96]
MADAATGSTANEEEPVEDIDPGYWDDEDDAQTQTTSLYSALLEHVYENGRTYHGYRSGTYWGPNDDQANNNLDLFHHIFNLTLKGQLTLAPIGDTPQRVLDLGTGTGIWAMDFADRYPSATVVGTDLSAIQPQWVPPNVQFEIDDFSQPWTFKKDWFDFIHARCLYGCIADYPTFYAQVLTHLQPGAWFEQVEISVVSRSDDGSTDGTYLERWSELALEAGDRIGKTFRIADELEERMVRSGFANVRCHRFRWPIGPWPKDPKLKEIGAYNRLACEEGIDGWALRPLTQVLDWSIEEVQVLCAHLRRDFRDKHIHAYQYM